MTPIGYLSLVMALGILILPETYVFFALTLTATWTAATAISFGPVLWPFEICILFFILRASARPGLDYIIKNVFNSRLGISIAIIGYGIAFWSLIAPKLFEGIDVFTPRLGIDIQVGSRSQLIFGPSNIAQFLYWIMHTSFVLTLIACRGYYRLNKIVSGVRFGFYGVLFLTIWQLASIYYGIFYPTDFFLNADYSLGLEVAILGMIRLNGTFPEASVLAGNFALISAFFLFDFFRINTVLSFLMFVVSSLLLLASLTTTGFAVLLVSFACMLILWILGFKEKKRQFLATILVVAFFISFIFFVSWKYDSIARNLLLDKSLSSSGQNRLDADLYSLDLFCSTYGLGVGFGSHRASSLAMTMLGCIGGLGGLLYVYALFFFSRYLIFFNRLNTGYSIVFGGAIFIYLISGALSIPDANMALLWLFLGFFLLSSGWRHADIIQANAPRRKVARRIVHGG